MKLCEDEIWTVRKACAEVMPFIALLCTLEKRRKVLVPAYKKFMFDTSLWVIKAALKVYMLLNITGFSRVSHSCGTLP